MQSTKRPVSKLRMALTWLLFVGITVGWIAFLIWRRQNSPAPAETPPPFAVAIISMVAGGFFFAAGAASYFILLFTDCFTFNFKAPVWSGFKARLYLANIVVLTGFALGAGFGITPLVGALWIGPEQLVYYGDSGDFAVTREQLVQIERKADSGGTSMLGGITHLILHVREADGSERQIRFHMEGQWTMGGKGRAMDELEERIVQWHAGTVPQVLA